MSLGRWFWDWKMRWRRAIKYQFKFIGLCFLNFHCWPLTTGLQVCPCIVNQTVYIYLHFSGETLFLFYEYLKCFGIIVSCLRKDYFWVLFKSKEMQRLLTSLIIIQPSSLTVTNCVASLERDRGPHTNTWTWSLHWAVASSETKGKERQSKKLKICMDCKLIKPALRHCNCCLYGPNGPW